MGPDPAAATIDQGRYDGTGNRSINASCAAIKVVATNAKRTWGPTPRRRSRSAAAPNRNAAMPCTIAMMKRCRVTLACGSPSTSVSHGVAHSPCNAHAVPAQVAESAESAAQNERRKSVRQAEQHGASRCEQQQRAFDASGSIAIEPYADWQLERCEGQKIDRREKAEIGGIKGQLCTEF